MNQKAPDYHNRALLSFRDAFNGNKQDQGDGIGASLPLSLTRPEAEFCHRHMYSIINFALWRSRELTATARYRAW